MKNAVIYLRVSTDKQDNGLEVQERECVEFAKREGYLVKKIYRSIESRSTKISEREDLMAAFSNLKKGETLIVQKVDRIGVLEELMQVKLIVKSKKLNLKYADGNNEDSPMSKFIENIMGVISELELDTIRSRTKKGLREKRQRGEYTGGNVPYGFESVADGCLKYNQAEQKIIKKIKAMRECKKTYRKILEWLNVETGSDWHYNQVRRIANRPADHWTITA